VLYLFHIKVLTLFSDERSYFFGNTLGAFEDLSELVLGKHDWFGWFRVESKEKELGLLLN
jgi:hypothetical protein